MTAAAPDDQDGAASCDSFFTAQGTAAESGDLAGTSGSKTASITKKGCGSGDDDLHEYDISLDCKRLTILGTFLFVVFPLAVLLLAALFGGLFACFRHVTYQEGFLYVASNLLGIANPLTNWAPGGPGWAEWEVAIAVVLDVYVALVALVCFGVMLNVVNLFEVPRAINRVVERFVTTHAVLVPMIALGVIIPLCYTTLCALFGALLSLAEDWSFLDGFLYVLSNSLQLATPFTDVVPATDGRELFDIVISSMAMGYIALFADYVVVLDPSRTIRRRFRGSLGARGVVDLATTPACHPLDHGDDDSGGPSHGAGNKSHESES